MTDTIYIILIVIGLAIIGTIILFIFRQLKNKKPMKITFDSNVWRIISTPSKFPSEPSLADFQKIRKAILNKKIDPYISETVFTIEAVQRKDRKDFFGSRKVKVSTTESVSDDGKINIGFSIGPEKGINFDNNPILKKHFEDAIELGFKITRLPRIGGLDNEDVEPFLFKQSGDELKKFHDRAFEVGRKIEECEAGVYHISKIGKKYDSQWTKGLKKAPENEDGLIIKAAAEWADGDSVSVCIGLRCDYFCTRDQAKSAGEKSVFSSNNLEWLERDYNLKVITPEALAKLI